MANRIINITMPAAVRSGEQFDVTVDYTADDDGNLEIEYIGSFDGTPSTVPLDPAATSKAFKMVITRRGEAELCRVEFRFGNLFPCLVEVTS